MVSEKGESKPVFEQVIPRLMHLFKGQDKAYGSYVVDHTMSNGKQKGRAKIKKGDFGTEFWNDLWLNHLSGKQSLGVFPINFSNECHWGAIDIDDYDIDHVKLINTMKLMELPMLAARTKSGGVHVFVFFKEKISAALLLPKLQSISAALGYSGVEVFPKQIQILEEKGDVGSFLNMPYFDADKSTRYGYDDKGQSLTLIDFLDKAEKLRVDPKEFCELSLTEQGGDQFKDGPPCLQHLASQGFPEGVRNNSLYSLAVFFKKSCPDTDGADGWKRMLIEANEKYMDPPLPLQELMNTVIKSVERKEYKYKCKDQPLSSHCQSALCRTRKFGVGCDAPEHLSFSGLRKIEVEPPIWIGDINGFPVQLSTEDLQLQQRFQRRCMEALNIMPQKMKEADWRAVVQEQLNNVEIIEVPKEGTAQDIFFQLLSDYCSKRICTEVQGLLMKKAYHDVEQAKILFRIPDIHKYIIDQGSRDFSQRDIIGILKLRSDVGTGSRSIKGKSTRYWWIEIKSLGIQTESFDTPEIEGPGM